MLYTGLSADRNVMQGFGLVLDVAKWADGMSPI